MKSYPLYIFTLELTSDVVANFLKNAKHCFQQEYRRWFSLEAIWRFWMSEASIRTQLFLWRTYIFDFIWTYNIVLLGLGKRWPIEVTASAQILEMRTIAYGITDFCNQENLS